MKANRHESPCSTGEATMTKFTVYAMFSFEVDTDEADADLIEVDAVHEAAMLVTPSDFALEEIVEWEIAEEKQP
jgi:hypothetical protein